MNTLWENYSFFFSFVSFFRSSSIFRRWEKKREGDTNSNLWVRLKLRKNLQLWLTDYGTALLVEYTSPVDSFGTVFFAKFLVQSRPFGIYHFTNRLKNNDFLFFNYSKFLIDTWNFWNYHSITLKTTKSKRHCNASTEKIRQFSNF